MIGQLLYTIIIFIVVFYGLSRWWSYRCRSKNTKWIEGLQRFVKENDGRQTGSGDPLLLIMCPASGRGKAMKIFPVCLQLLSEKGFAVEVYVTKDGSDIETLSERKELSAYKVIAILAGDSSIFQFIQGPLRKTGGRWPYAAPILHLPGGMGNVISGEFHNWADHTQIIPKISLNKVVKGTVIKISSPETEPIYAIHNCFDGFQRILLERMNTERSVGSFGMMGVLFLFAQTLWRVDHGMKPFYFLVINSDVEGLGNSLGFGIRRTDDTLAVVQVKEYKSFLGAFSEGIGIMSGKIAQQAAKNELPDHISVKIGKKFIFSGHDYHLVCDGHTGGELYVKGNMVTVESVPDAVPYMHI